MAMTAFWTFDQNNSGGRFVFDKKRGITHYVIIEAESVEDANNIARDIGLYYNGVANGIDCGCCGDRWNEAIDERGDFKPSIYGAPLIPDIDGKLSIQHGATWMKPGYEACIHWLAPSPVSKTWCGILNRPHGHGYHQEEDADE